MTYPLAPNGIFWSLQGEGHLQGTPMVFVRLAGCDVNCPSCDTDYRTDRRASVGEIVSEIKELETAAEWIWITGGEPTIHDIAPLVLALQGHGWKVAIATAGEHPVTAPVDWLSVSPHRPGVLRQRFGHEAKLVPGLWGEPGVLRKSIEGADFWFRYVQPHATDPRYGMEWAVDFVRQNPGWCLSEQRHKRWGLP